MLLEDERRRRRRRCCQEPDGSPHRKFAVTPSPSPPHFSLPRCGNEGTLSRLSQRKTRSRVFNKAQAEAERESIGRERGTLRRRRREKKKAWGSTSPLRSPPFSSTLPTDDVTLRSVVTVVANSCPPTQSVTMEEADRGLSGGSIGLKRLLSCPLSLFSRVQALAFRAFARRRARVRDKKERRKRRKAKKETKSKESVVRYERAVPLCLFLREREGGEVEGGEVLSEKKKFSAQKLEIKTSRARTREVSELKKSIAPSLLPWRPLQTPPWRWRDNPSTGVILSSATTSSRCRGT